MPNDGVINLNELFVGQRYPLLRVRLERWKNIPDPQKILILDLHGRQGKLHVPNYELIWRNYLTPTLIDFVNGSLIPLYDIVLVDTPDNLVMELVSRTSIYLPD